MKRSDRVHARAAGPESFGASLPPRVARCGAREPAAQPWQLCSFRLEPGPLQTPRAAGVDVPGAGTVTGDGRGEKPRKPQLLRPHLSGVSARSTSDTSHPQQPFPSKTL